MYTHHQQLLLDGINVGRTGLVEAERERERDQHTMQQVSARNHPWSSKNNWDKPPYTRHNGVGHMSHYLSGLARGATLLEG